MNHVDAMLYADALEDGSVFIRIVDQRTGQVMEHTLEPGTCLHLQTEIAPTGIRSTDFEVDDALGT